MLIVEPAAEQVAQTEDPFFEIGRKQFQRGIERLRSYLKHPHDQRDAIFRLCDSLCESSREMLFRLNRITRSELVTVVGLFADAAAAVDEAINKTLAGTSDEDDARGYLAHIKARVELLKRYLH